MEDLLKLLAVPSHTGNTDQMYNYLREIGLSNGWTLYADKSWNLYVKKGESETYPCVVAHMDTVHKIEKGGIYPVVVSGNITGINPLTMEQTGIGGDDKCGIWAALHCLNVLPACKAVFFVDEESGCRGATNCDLEFFKDCRYILQADRRGNSDFVDYITGTISSDQFLEAVKPAYEAHGYSRSHGMMTDVMKLRDRKVGVSAANMSAGYWNPHGDQEYINIEDLMNVCSLMERICSDVTEVFPFVYEYTGYDQSARWARASWAKGDAKGNSYDPFPDYSPGTHYGTVPFERCAYCNTLTRVNDLMETEPQPICLDCAVHKDTKGVYPISEQGSFWKRLVDANGHGRRRKKKKKGRWRFGTSVTASPGTSHDQKT